MNENGIKIRSVLFGLLIIAAGILLYLFNVEVLNSDYKTIVFSWQSLLIAIGFVNLFSRNHYFFGVILILTGGFFLLRELDVPEFDFLVQSGWPLLLVVIGVLILFKGIFSKRCFSGKCRSGRIYSNVERGLNGHFHRPEWRDEKRWRHEKNASGFIDRNFVFGGSKEKLDIKEFKGGEINCVFGGVELDLRDSQLAEGMNVLEINTVFGGTVIYVPIEWKIEIRQTHVFGSFVDNRPKPGFEVDEKRILILEVSSVFGGGEIKCKDE